MDCMRAGVRVLSWQDKCYSYIQEVAHSLAPPAAVPARHTGIADPWEGTGMGTQLVLGDWPLAVDMAVHMTAVGTAAVGMASPAGAVVPPAVSAGSCKPAKVA